MKHAHSSDSLINSLTVSKAIPLFLFIGGMAVLVSCAGSQSGPAATPIPPGTVQPSASVTSGVGSFQGPIVNSTGVVQAVLTMDVWVKDGRTNAQLTLSPSGATAVIPLSSGNQAFAIDLPATSFGDNQHVAVSGSWTGSAWTGQISSNIDAAANASNSFSLTAGASSQAAVSVGLPSGTFDGVLKYKSSGGVRGVSLTLVPTKDIGDALASTLTSKVSLDAYLKYANNSQETLTNVVWDRETSTLSADGTVLTSLGTTSVRCKMSEMNSGGKDILQCALGTSKTSAPVAVGPLSQKHVVLAPPYPGPPVQPNPIPQPGPPPAPTPYVPPPAQPAPAPTAAPVPVPTAIPVPVPTPSSMIVRNTKDYVGSAVFTNDKGQKQTRTLTLTVTLTSETTGEAQPAKVKFVIDGSRVGASFNDGSYNRATGSLSAKTPFGVGALPGQLDLSCTGVNFDNPQYDFVCDYESSVTSVTGEFHLKGTQQ